MDRWEDLLTSVESAATGHQRPVDILLVSDHNDELLAAAQQRFGGSSLVRVLANEHRRGLSGARNTGIERANGDVVAFLDDDAAAAPEWLAALLKHYQDPLVIGVGGSAIPGWPDGAGHNRPAIFPVSATRSRGELDWVVGCTYNGQPESAAPVRNLMGCNMSFRRPVFDAVGGFSEDLGRVGRVPLGAEETEFCIRARQHQPDGEIIFEPLAVVRHRVSSDRVRWKYLLTRCYAEGLSKAVVAKKVGAGPALESERRYVTHVLGAAFLREVLKGARGDRSGFTGAVAIFGGLAATTVGYLRGSANHSR